MAASSERLRRWGRVISVFLGLTVGWICGRSMLDLNLDQANAEGQVTMDRVPIEDKGNSSGVSFSTTDPKSEVKVRKNSSTSHVPLSAEAEMSEIRRSILRSANPGESLNRLEQVMPKLGADDIIRVIAGRPFQESELLLFNVFVARFGQTATPASLRKLAAAYQAANQPMMRHQLGMLPSGIWNPDLAEALTGVLDDQLVDDAGARPELTRGVSIALGNIATTESVEVLFRGLVKSEDKARERALLEGLENVTDEAVFPLLKEVIEGDHPMSRNPEILEVTVRMLGNFPSEHTRDSLELLMNDDDPDMVIWATETAEVLRNRFNSN